MKKRVCRLHVYVIFAIVLISITAQADYYVDDDYGNTAPGTGTSTDPFLTIQDAVDNTPQGSTIHVAEGTYDGFLIHADAVYDDKTLIGAGPDLCFIDKNYEDRVIDIYGGDNLTISGFTIIHGEAQYGSGIQFRYSNNINIINCNILTNKAVTQSCPFSSCPDMAYGAGAYIENSSVNFYSTLFKNNRCLRYYFMSGSSYHGKGGAIMASNSTVNLYSCVLTGNYANYGGALSSDYDADVYAENTIIYHNYGTWNANIYTQGTFAPTYCDIQGGWTGQGNIDLEPCFVNPTAMDYHLDITSPCIDTGNNNNLTAYDMDGQPRIMDGRNDGNAVVDMGLDEFLYVHPTTLYVNKSWHSIPLYSEVDGHIFGYDAFSSIQAALNIAEYGDIIMIAPDHHRGPITLVDGVSLKGEDVYNTFIDGVDSVRCLEANKCDDTTVIEGLTFINGYSATEGGAAYVTQSEIKFLRCRFLASASVGDGGGLYANDSQCQFTNCVFYDNNAGRGAAIALDADLGSQIINCTVVENTAVTHGGGLYADNALVAPEVTNSIFWLNDDTQIEYSGTAPVVTYCDIYHQEIIGTGNFEIDPDFINPSNGNFNLNTYSGCIDRGNNAAIPAWVTTDIDGDNRIIDGDYDFTATVDVGVDEVPIPTEVWVSADWLGLSYGDPIPGESWTFGITAFATISDGLAGVNAPGTVHVLEGTYEELITLRPDVNVIAEGDPSRTIISGADHNRCIEGATIPQSTLIQGFTITQGRDAMGGGVHLTDSACKFVHCIFTENLADLGGAMYLINSSPSIINCLFHDNEAGQSACIHNTATSSPLVVNSTFADNLIQNSAEVMGSYGSSNPTVINSIVWSNSALPLYDDASSLTTATYSVIKNGFKGTGNTDADPVFVNPSHDNFHIGAMSCCIDAGDDASIYTDYDCDGDSRQLLGYSTGSPRVDIGYDEYIYEAPNTVWVDHYFSSFDPGNHVAGHVIGYDAYDTITEAIDNIAFPGTIYVESGIYYENITMRNELVIIGSDPNTTIIDGNSNGSVVTAQDLDETAQIQGFTITNGSGKLHSDNDRYGGGFYLLNADIIITDCIIKGNCADTGRSMYITVSSPIITNCCFSAQGHGTNCNGRAIYSGGSHPIFIQDAFYNIDTAVATITYGSAKFYNCTSYGNTYFVGYGCAILLSGSSYIEIANSIFYDPIAEVAGYEGCTYAFTNSIIGSVGTIGSGSPTGTAENCFYTDPRFVDGDNGDFHLDYDSPCIDAGDSNSVPTNLAMDIFGGDRLIDGDCNGDPNVDMGVHEFTWLPFGSVDGDCKIDFYDVAAIANVWLAQSGDAFYDESYDPNHDGKIDLDDIAIICEYWLIGADVNML